MVSNVTESCGLSGLQPVHCAVFHTGGKMIFFNDFKVFLLYVWHRLDQNHIMHSFMHPAESVNTEVLTSEILHFKNQCSNHVMFLFQEAALAPDDSVWVFTSTKSALIIFTLRSARAEKESHHQSSSDTTIHHGNGKIKSRAAILIQKKQYERVRTGASEITHSQWDWFWLFLVENKLKLWIKYCLT